MALNPFLTPVASCLLIISLASFLQADERPNIILIMADDFGYECVAANGGESYQTPNLDSLAASGMRFEHCCSQPLCTPSRVQIMTGLYNSRNYRRFGLLPPQSFTFGNLLRGAGYDTCIVGKWQLGGGLNGPEVAGFDEYCLWQVVGRRNRYPNPGLEINGQVRDFANGEYGPDLVCDYGCEFIDRQARKKAPFFLYYPMILTHSPFEATPESPEWKPAARRGDTQEMRRRELEDTKHFQDMVQYADKLVGRILSKLDEHQLREKTLVLFTGDNGTAVDIVSQFQGKPWKGGKGRMTDKGTRVPLIVSRPGTIPAGRVNQDLIDFSDILPTLADAAHAEIPDHLKLDGHSFLAQLNGETGSPRGWVYCWYFRNGVPIPGGESHQAGESARTLRYKLYHDGGFFDLLHDPDERAPLASEELTFEQQMVRGQLQKVLDQHTRPGFYQTAVEAKN